MKFILTTLSVIVLSRCNLPTYSFAPYSRIDSRGIEQQFVPAGSYLRGTKNIESIEGPDWIRSIINSEQPQHSVTISRNFWIDKYEVSNAAFADFVRDGAYQNQTIWSSQGWAWLQQRQQEVRLPLVCGGQKAKLPRVCITWFEAEAYATWRGGRLPTEAEWEYAARGPESLIYPWGIEFDASKANVIGSSAAVNVDSLPNGKSWIGAYNMAGNAMEWVQDWLDFDYYERRIELDPQGPATGRIKIEKGGWWGSNAAVSRSAYHHFEDPPDYQDNHIGFRVLTPPDTFGN